MTPVDVRWILGIAHKAGKIALSHFGKTAGRLKADCSWVTQADLDVEAYLRKELASTRPHDAILGEEGADPPPASPVVWAIDPIDGTRAFNHGLPVWGVSIGVFENGEPTMGVFILPVLGDVYHTDGATAFYNGRALAPQTPALDANALLLVSEGAFKRLRIDYPGKTLSLGSAAAHLCYVARGSAVGAFDHASIWDYAAGAAILNVLGIRLRYLSGRTVDFEELFRAGAAPEPTLAASDRHFGALQRAFQRAE
ncbi:MAG: inositol monophosphatase [Candidatus Latescibacteria bacterium]|nr:inositol monophosphatase [Candidatus Latescibacterota bacterium]